MVKTIQMTIDYDLLEQVDQTVQTLNTTRSAFIRDALEQALQVFKIKQLEKEDALGYANVPANIAEVSVWESEQIWGDEWNAVK